MKACSKCGRPESPYDARCICGHLYDDGGVAPVLNREPETFVKLSPDGDPNYAPPTTAILAPSGDVEGGFSKRMRQELTAGGWVLAVLIVSGLCIGIARSDFSIPRMLGDGLAVVIITYLVAFLASFVVPSPHRFAGRMAIFILLSIVMTTLKCQEAFEAADEYARRRMQLKLDGY